ncbi:MAG: hypothetical protein LIO79_08220 [Rikenellaceae bacterium]|nr:hypothetical protein [Rikenellaceae bacterium]
MKEKRILNMLHSVTDCIFYGNACISSKEINESTELSAEEIRECSIVSAKVLDSVYPKKSATSVEIVKQCLESYMKCVKKLKTTDSNYTDEYRDALLQSINLFAKYINGPSSGNSGTKTESEEDMACAIDGGCGEDRYMY